VSFVALGLSSCQNKLEHKGYDWQEITSTSYGENKTFHVDNNRVSCEFTVPKDRKGKKTSNKKSLICKAWTKIVFESPRRMKFVSKHGEAKDVYAAWIETGVRYNCDRYKSAVTAYQLYGTDGELAYSRWDHSPVEAMVEMNTADYDIFEHVCKKGEELRK